MARSSWGISSARKPYKISASTQRENSREEGQRRTKTTNAEKNITPTSEPSLTERAKEKDPGVVRSSLNAMQFVEARIGPGTSKRPVSGLVHQKERDRTCNHVFRSVSVMISTPCQLLLLHSVFIRTFKANYNWLLLKHDSLQRSIPTLGTKFKAIQTIKTIN